MRPAAVQQQQQQEHTLVIGSSGTRRQQQHTAAMVAAHACAAADEHVALGCKAAALERSRLLHRRRTCGCRWHRFPVFVQVAPRAPSAATAAPATTPQRPASMTTIAEALSRFCRLWCKCSARPQQTTGACLGPGIRPSNLLVPVGFLMRRGE